MSNKKTKRSSGAKNMKKKVGKPALSKKKAGGRGKRYTADQKAKVVKFVNDHNAKNNGRGGATAASKKFKISQITIGLWMKSASPSKPKAVKSTAKRGRKKAALSFPVKLRRIADLHESISKLKTQLASLEAEYEALKKDL